MVQLSFDGQPAEPTAVSVRAISLTQPWATLVAIGAKTIETRSWGTSYRGPLAIHASKAFGYDEQLLCYSEPFRWVLQSAGFVDPIQLPRGAVLAIARLVGCRRVDRRTELPSVLSNEFAFGDFSEGRYLWDLEVLERLSPPQNAKGALGIWHWSPRA